MARNAGNGPEQGLERTRGAVDTAQYWPPPYESGKFLADVLGGKENSLSLVRSLGRIGVEVSVSGAADTWGLYSTYCSRRYPVPRKTSPKHYWQRLLLSEEALLERAP